MAQFKKAFEWLLIAISCFTIGILVYSFYLRFSINMPLGAYEDYFGQMVDRLRQGKPLYSHPTLEYIPLIYAPLYAYLSSLFIWGDLSYTSMRWVSQISLFISIVLLFQMPNIISGEKDSKKKISNYKLGFVLCGLLAASYPLSGYWLDLAKVDSLLILLLTGIIFFYYQAWNEINATKCNIYLLLLGISSALLPFVKQNFLILLPILIFFLFLKYNIKKTMAVLLIQISVISLIVIRELLIPDNHFFYYIFVLPGLHPFTEKGFFIELIRVLAPVSLLAGILIYSYSITEMKKDFRAIVKHKLSFLFVLTVTVFMLGFVARFKQGAVVNSLLYPYILLLILNFAILAEFKSLSARLQITSFLFFLIQFLTIWHNPMNDFQIWKSMQSDQFVYKDSFCKMPKQIYLEDFSFQRKLFCQEEDFFINYGVIDIMSSERLMKPIIEVYSDALRQKHFQRIITANFEALLNADLLYTSTQAHYLKKPNVRNHSFMKVMEMKVLQNQHYVQIQKEELSDNESIFVNIHDKYYRPVQLYRPKD
jgi:hypothetical protein